MNAYISRGWDTWMLFKFAPECYSSKPSIGFNRHVGFKLWGKFKFNQIAGVIHIATRTGQVDSNKRPLFDPEILQFLNSSHFIEQYYCDSQITN